MGDISVVVEALDGPESELALRSTIHGAGRVMSRTQAAGKSRFKRGRRIQPTDGKISRKMMKRWLDRRGVELRGTGTDEPLAATRGSRRCCATTTAPFASCTFGADRRGDGVA